MTLAKYAAVAALGLSTVFVGNAAQAQKSKDTLRMPWVRQIQVLDPFMETGAPTRFVAETIHDALVAYDEHGSKEIVGLLAKSWKVIDNQVLEFDLRDDVKWQDGEKFSADDVVYFLGWASGPDFKLRYKETWAWIDKIEKLGPYKVRITAKKPAPYYLTRLAFESWIYPEHIHSKLEDKRDYGKNPLGTGPYRAIKVDKNGIDLKKNPYFLHGGTAKPVSNIGNVQIRLVPDVGNQIAGFIAGDWDLLIDPNQDQANELAKDKRFVMETSATAGNLFFTLDANGISENKSLTDPRVRKALFMGIDRQEISRLYWGQDKVAFSTDNLCFKFMAGCDYTEGTIKYDPAGAKRLLAEAAPNGVDIEISTVSNTVVSELAKVIQAQLTKIGFRVKIDARTFANFFERETKGQTQIRMSIYSQRLPDVSGMIGFFYEADAPRNRYFMDQKMADLAIRSDKEMDPTKRKGIIKELLDYNAEQALILPVTSTAVVFTHTNEITAAPGGRLEIFGFYMGDLNWK